MNGKIGKEEIGLMKMCRIDYVVLLVVDLNVVCCFYYEVFDMLVFDQ